MNWAYGKNFGWDEDISPVPIYLLTEEDHKNSQEFWDEEDPLDDPINDIIDTN